MAVAGHETTVGAIGALLLRLAEHPEVRAALEARPDLAFSAIEESTDRGVAKVGGLITFGGLITLSTDRGGTSITISG